MLFDKDAMLQWWEMGITFYSIEILCFSGRKHLLWAASDRDTILRWVGDSYQVLHLIEMLIWSKKRQVLRATSNTDDMAAVGIKSYIW